MNSEKNEFQKQLEKGRNTLYQLLSTRAIIIKNHTQLLNISMEYRTLSFHIKGPARYKYIEVIKVLLRVFASFGVFSLIPGSKAGSQGPLVKSKVLLWIPSSLGSFWSWFQLPTSTLPLPF